MRTSICTLGLVLALAGSATAQTLTNLSANNSAPSTAPGVGITNYLFSNFSLTHLFAPFSMTARTQTPTTANIPNPNTPAYFQAFGYQRLTPPLPAGVPHRRIIVQNRS